MAVLGSIFFKRTLKQFLECDDLDSSKGRALVEKIRSAAAESIEHLIKAIPETAGDHREVLVQACLDNLDAKNQELFLENLDNDATEIRTAAASVLAQTGDINPSRLFQKLHQPNTSKTEIIEILSFQSEQLKPEQIITNALRLDKGNAERLLKLAEESKLPIDLDLLRLDPASIESPSVKIMLLRYLGRVKQGDVSQLIAKFLADPNRTVIIEALKSLKHLDAKFDASVILPYIESLSEAEHGMAMEILEAQADEDLVPKLAPWTAGKSEELRERFARLLASHATPAGLEKFLRMLEQQEWYGREQALKVIKKCAGEKLIAAARELTDHPHAFVQEQAQRLASQVSDPDDLEKLAENALSKDWQVRESAVEALGHCNQREALGILQQVFERYSDSMPGVLRAVGELGFGKGLEIAFAGLRMPEARVQREALEAIGKLSSRKHAAQVRDKLLKKVPSLQATVRDTAREVVNRLTDEYGLSAMEFDQETYFDTSLVNQAAQAAASNIDQATEHVSVASMFSEEEFVGIEDFKHGDLWMKRYRIDREIGRGAMGRVMLADDEIVGEHVILKFMHPELTAEESSRERFLREVKYSRKVSHPNVIRIHDMLFQGNLSAISMEYFESSGLDIRLRELKRFDVVTGLEILRQVALGMAAAHDQDVIHRDLKPSNILMNEVGLIKVVDFGIASATSGSESTLTKTGSIIGTPAYLSPERAKGKDADHRSDIYALGIIAYGMFTGRLPYSGEPMSLLFQHLEGNALPVQEIRPELGPDISDLVSNMMTVDIDARIQTMGDVVNIIAGMQQSMTDTAE